MPDRRLHRGPHPEDRQLFGDAGLPALRSGVADLSWLLSREYAGDAALKLVGDRYTLKRRQRIAVARCSASDQAVADRDARCCQLAPRSVPWIGIIGIPGYGLLIDGYNLLTTIEAALAGGVILLGRDGCFRDMASMHGTYRKVDETMPAIELIGRSLEDLRVAAAHWLLDSPVSNSGRTAALLRERAAQRGWPWTVELAHNPDRVLIDAPDENQLIVTADSVVLDRCGNWVNLARWIVENRLPQAWIIDLCGQP